MSRKTVSIEDAKPGMIVDDEILDGRGNVLVRQGVALNDAWIKGLKTRGIRNVVIRDQEATKAADEPIAGSQVDRVVVERQRRIDTMFAGMTENPVMAALAEAAKKHVRAKLAGGSSP